MIGADMSQVRATNGRWTNVGTGSGWGREGTEESIRCEC